MKNLLFSIAGSQNFKVEIAYSSQHQMTVINAVTGTRFKIRSAEMD